jgi:hypothetical protein
VVHLHNPYSEPEAESGASGANKPIPQARSS